MITQQFPKLRALFIGDLTAEDSEISWIQQSDITPILNALPDLEVLTVRGGEGLVVKPFTHQKLTSLTFQTGGLPKNVVGNVGQSTAPALEHLEFWFGVQDYGGDTEIADLEPLLHSKSFPSLKSLGLRNSVFTAEFMTMLASAPLVQRLQKLDLSQGVLTDEHVQLLVDSKSFGHLTALNLTENYLSEDMVQKLQKLSFEVNASEQKEPDEWDEEICYYPSVTE